MSKYSDEQKYILFGFFPTYYTTVLHHSRFQNITYKETQMLSEKTRVLGESFAASGLSEIDFSILNEVISFVDSYLKSGNLDKDEWKRLLLELEKIEQPLNEVAEDYKEGGVSDENGFGAPIVLFTFRYAQNILLVCDLVDEEFEGAEKVRILKLLDERKRSDPDNDRKLEFV